MNRIHPARSHGLQAMIGSMPTNEFLRRQRSLPLDALLREVRDPSDPTTLHVQE